eukprot:Ihof_evm2s852 gene=Ihof_evmTU2s852
MTSFSTPNSFTSSPKETNNIADKSHDLQKSIQCPKTYTLSDRMNELINKWNKVADWMTMSEQ